VTSKPRSAIALTFIGALALGLFVLLVALGTWQIERRAWKHALIRQVEARVHAAPVPALGPREWRGITAENRAYLRVNVQGRFLNNLETYVQAATVLGSGYWVLTPLRTEKGYIVLINRGFVAPDKRKVHGRIAGRVTITGLLRITEKDGGFLRRNDPQANRWYSRDVQAIAAKRSLSNAAPYFIDAEASDTKDAPVGGLTVVTFSDSHMAYALTWYSLALIVLGGGAFFAREEWRILMKKSTARRLNNSSKSPAN